MVAAASLAVRVLDDNSITSNAKPFAISAFYTAIALLLRVLLCLLMIDPYVLTPK